MTEEFRFQIPRPRKVLVMGHVSPDGDSVSSATALAKYYGARLFFESALSPTLAWIPEEAGVMAETETAPLVEWKPTHIVVVDCAPTRDRTGFPIEHCLAHDPGLKVVNFDHHADRAGEVSDKTTYKVIRPECSSTSEILVNEGLRYPFLYAGLATDTVFFKYSNPNRAMEAVLRLGLSEEQIARYRESLDIHLDYDQLCMLLKAEAKYIDFPSIGRNLLVVRFGATDADVNVTLLGLTRGFDYVAIIQPNGRTSLRTRVNGVDLAVFAKRYGGGGHAKACGCKVDDQDRFVAELGDFIVKMNSEIGTSYGEKG